MAFALGERVRIAVAAQRLEHPGLPPGRCVTVSVGAASLREDRCVIDGGVLLKDADDALYVSKIKGRNMTTHAYALSLQRDSGPDMNKPVDHAGVAPLSSAA